MHRNVESEEINMRPVVDVASLAETDKPQLPPLSPVTAEQDMNKHYNVHELRVCEDGKKQYYYNNKHSDNNHELREINFDDFREMGKLNKKIIKRLQSTPTMRKKAKDLEKKTGNILKKLINKISEMIPDVQREKARRDISKYQLRESRGPRRTEPSGEEDDDCLELMMKMTIGEERGEEKAPRAQLCEEIMKIRIAGVEMTEIEKTACPQGGSSRRGRKWKRGRQLTVMPTILEDTANLEGTAEDDMSFCDDWDILHEEDFQTEEEESQARLQLAKAEVALIKAYFR